MSNWRRRRGWIVGTWAAIAAGVLGGVVVSGDDTPPSPVSNGTAHFWVDTNGGTCTRQSTPGAYVDAAACSSIQAAVAASSSGDTVRVKAGSYGAQNVTASKSSPGVTVIAESSTTLSSLRPTGAWVEFQGFNVSSGLDIENTGSGTPSNITFRNVDWSGGWWLQNCCTNIAQYGGRIHDVSTSAPTGIMFQGDTSSTPISNITLDGVEIDHITHSVSGNHFEAVRIQGWASGINLRRNYFHDNGVNSSQVFFSSLTTGSAHSPTSLVVEGNKFAVPVSGAGDPAAFFQLNGNMQNGACPTLTVQHNTSTGVPILGGIATSSYWSCSTASNVTFTGNITPRNAICDAASTYNVYIGTPSQTCGTGDQAASSTSTAGLTGDGFHITTGSPAKDAGGPSCPTTDIDAEARPQGVACDAGADEVG